MRRILRLVMVLTMVMWSGATQAQNGGGQRRSFKPFKVDVGINLTFPASTHLSVGGGFFLEPRYSINDGLQIGLHLGSNIIGEGRFLFQNTEAIAKAQAIGNLALTGEYQFTRGNFRPFIGMTAGIYRRSDYEIIDNTDGKIINHHGTNVNLGMAPRIGLVAGKFRMNATYHFAGEGITDFLSIGLGMQFGGGKMSGNKGN